MRRIPNTVYEIIAPYLTISDDKFQVDTHYLFVTIIHNTVNWNTENDRFDQTSDLLDVNIEEGRR